MTFWKSLPKKCDYLFCWQVFQSLGFTAFEAKVTVAIEQKFQKINWYWRRAKRQETSENCCIFKTLVNHYSSVNYSLAAPLQAFQMGLARKVELFLQVPPSRMLTRCTRVPHKRQKFLILSVGKKVLGSVAVGLLVHCPLIVFLGFVHFSFVCNINWLND